MRDQVASSVLNNVCGTIHNELFNHETGFMAPVILHVNKHNHWRQTGRKSGGAEWEFETYLVKFETYSVLRDYETKKTTGAAAPAAPASLAPMLIEHTFSYSLVGAKFKYLERFCGFLYLQALGDCEKKQSPNMSNPGSQVN